MRLKELFENLETIIYYSPEEENINEDSEFLSDIEKSIIDALVYAQAQNLDHIYLHHIEDRVRRQGMEIPTEFLMDFLIARQDIDEIVPVNATHRGEKAYEIVFTDSEQDVRRRVGQDQEEEEEEMFDRTAKNQAMKNVKDDE